MDRPYTCLNPRLRCHEPSRRVLVQAARRVCPLRPDFLTILMFFSPHLLGPPPSILDNLQGPEDEPTKTRKRRATPRFDANFLSSSLLFCLFPLLLFPPLLFGIREHTFPPPRHRPLRLVGPASPFFGLPLSCSTPIFSFPPPFPSLPPLHLLQTCLLSN
ncbi:hypothetical protein BDY24DRAFT_94811 [Mrakia frigida]|uniref:uncharacterized protein n=1 Tax=Mrakia frigida TaxID=29902 RepID=UPI003FCC18F0